LRGLRAQKDDPVEFSNDIYGATYHPLYLVTGGTGSNRSTGRILLWLSRAHVFGGRVFVSTCDVAAPMPDPEEANLRA
jgi:hypothetical protein